MYVCIVQECDEDPCCEYQTCKLKSGAHCAYGECCYNCQVNKASFHNTLLANNSPHRDTNHCLLLDDMICVCVQYLPGGTVCRSSTDECDLPEYCNGSSSLCQSDVFVQVSPDIFQLLPQPPQLCPSDLQIYIRRTILYRDVCSADTETLQAASRNFPC